MSYSDLYQQFLSDLDDTESPKVDEEPASFEQISYIRSLLESNAVNAISDTELNQIGYWLSYGITYKDASLLINRILEAQPDEPPIYSERGLAKWIREKKLSNDI